MKSALVRGGGGGGRGEGCCHPNCSPLVTEPRFTILGLVVIVVQHRHRRHFFRGGSPPFFYSRSIPPSLGPHATAFGHPIAPLIVCMYSQPSLIYYRLLFSSLCASSFDVTSFFFTSPPSSLLFFWTPHWCVVDRDGVSCERLTDRVCWPDDLVVWVWLSGCGWTSKDRDQLVVE